MTIEMRFSKKGHVTKVYCREHTRAVLLSKLGPLVDKPQAARSEVIFSNIEKHYQDHHWKTGGKNAG